jgi:CTP:molybdopterin cytidylyltransferase MocA
LTAAPTAILIPAAGAARRMRGRDKLLEPVDGRPLLARTAAVALATGAPVVVTLPPDRPERAAALAGLPVVTVTVADAAEGLGASIRAGMAALPAGAGAVLLLLADLPEIETADLAAMIAAQARTGGILRASAGDGTPGHPVILPSRLFPELAALAGDEGARALLRRHPVTPWPLPGRRAVTDLDTPEDWAAWRAARRAP